MKNFENKIPKGIKENEYALAEYIDIMEEIFLAYKRLLKLGVKPEDAQCILPK